MAVGLQVTVSGAPMQGWWHRKLERAIADGLKEAEDTLVQRGWVDVRTMLDRVLRHQTPYYTTQIMIHDNKVDDNGVIYGPWLNGTGSRNLTTRFKGYGVFRKVAQRLDREAQRVTEEAIARHTKDFR